MVRAACGEQQGALGPADAPAEGPDRGDDPPRGAHPRPDREDQDDQGRQDQDQGGEALRGLCLRRDEARGRRAHPAGHLLPDQGDDRRGRLHRHRRAPDPHGDARGEKMLLDSRAPEDEPTIRLLFEKGENVTIRRAPSRTTRAPWTRSSPRRARSACSSRSSGARRPWTSRSGRSPRSTRPLVELSADIESRVRRSMGPDSRYSLGTVRARIVTIREYAFENYEGTDRLAVDLPRPKGSSDRRVTSSRSSGARRPWTSRSSVAGRQGRRGLSGFIPIRRGTRPHRPSFTPPHDRLAVDLARPFDRRTDRRVDLLVVRARAQASWPRARCAPRSVPAIG